jgi:hypothetical protein
MLRNFLRVRALRQLAVLGIAVAGSLTFAVPGQAVETGLLHLRCTNPVNGANWGVLVDLDRNLVDGRSATITDKWISWRDLKQGFFDFERATGRLQLRAASSTGGYFLRYTCQPE